MKFLSAVAAAGGAAMLVVSPASATVGAPGIGDSYFAFRYECDSGVRTFPPEWSSSVKEEKPATFVRSGRGMYGTAMCRQYRS